MDQIQTVSTVSKNLSISSRMLRYYEQIGLIESQRAEDYAYRVYDAEAIRRLRQIIILRKLRVPVKQIREIFSNSSALGVIEVFERNISELDEQMTGDVTKAGGQRCADYLPSANDRGSSSLFRKSGIWSGAGSDRYD